MPSYLIHQGTAESREAKAREIFKDHLVEEVRGKKKGLIDVLTIRELRLHIQTKPPAGKRRGVLILEAQKMNEAAQNTILKSLEEPPASTDFILTSPNPKQLLPTVSSRCGLITAENKKEEEASPLAKKFINLSAAKRLNVFDEEVGYDSDAALNFLSALEIVWRKDLTNPKAAAALKKTWETKKLLRSPQTNVKITVDGYLLSW